MSLAPAGGVWVPMAQKALRQAIMTGAQAVKVLRSQGAAAARSKLETVPIRSTPSHSLYASKTTRYHQPVHPLAWRRQLRQRAARWLSSTVGRIRGLHSGVGKNTASPARFVDRVAYLQTRVGVQAVWKATGRTPFASTLRPNLTGGALPRTAGGYATGGSGSARYFSHTPAAPAQVVQNVSQAMRAFWVSGQRARFDGADSRGRPCYKAVSALEEETARRLAVPVLPKMAPGAFVDFALTPTITGLASATAGATAGAGVAVPPPTLAMEGFLDVLSVDFSRALKDLSATLADLRTLARLGDLPVLLESGHGPVLRVRFPGFDADTVDRLCSDLGVTRGVVGQDPQWDATLGASAALRFPFAPVAGPGSGLDFYDEHEHEPPLTISSHHSHRSPLPSAYSSFLDAEDVESDYDYEELFGDAGLYNENPWLASLPASSDAGGGLASMSPPREPEPLLPAPRPATEMDGLEGIHRFIAECDRNRGIF